MPGPSFMGLGSWVWSCRIGRRAALGRVVLYMCSSAPSAPLNGVARPNQTISMAGSAPNAGAAKRPLRELLTGLLCALCCALPVSAWAVRPVRVYEVDLHGGQTPAALQEAMREALVRATGRRDSATDPVFANLIGSATNYVKAYTSGPHGESQVVFDNVAVEHA